MGSSSSKVAKTAASAAIRRQYPQRVPAAPRTTSAPKAPSPPAPEAAAGPTVYPAPYASETKNDTVSLDTRDPDFAASLRSLGPVQPNSTLSNTSTFRTTSKCPSASSRTPLSNDPSPPMGPNIFPDPSQNPALVILESRNRLAEEAEKEFAQSRIGGTGRRFLDVGVIRQILTLRDDKGMEAGQIEKSLGLAKGVVAMLGAVGEARVGKIDKDDAGIYG